ncbi:hypothetical protein [Maribacter sp.]|uniref:hypothetical protein n=1 Tax=Maribacter sp. TaxID=1897614 RepID=UPI001758E7E8|nr:hypothetical protein [Maribacter sp.]HDZ04994.1 hypothetical protein [Maribacter sp.]HEA80530.1 hypothetical protein [Maribacter sp.]
MKFLKYFLLTIGVLGLVATILNVFYFKDASNSNIYSAAGSIYLIWISFKFEKMIAQLNSKTKSA